MKKTANILFVTVITAAMIFAFLLAGVRLFGIKPYTVLSGSMEPEYQVGSLIYVKEAEADELDVNVPITFVTENGTVVTHRIIEVVYDEKDPSATHYITKGDANTTPDPEPVYIGNVIGTPIFSIPVLGYISNFVRTPPGCYVIIGALTLFVLLAFLPDVFGKKNAQTEPEETDASSEDSDRSDPPAKD